MVRIAKSENPDEWYDRGVKAFDGFNLEQAVEYFETALDYRSDFVDALIKLAITRAYLNQGGPAISALKKATKLNPDIFSHWHYVALLLASRDKVKDAFKAMREAEKIKSDCVKEWCQLASVLVSQERLSDANRAMREVERIKPNCPEEWYTLRVKLLEIKRLDDAIDVVEKAVEMKDDYVEAWYELGELYKKKGWFEKAESAQSRAADLGYSEEPKNIARDTYVPQYPIRIVKGRLISDQTYLVQNIRRGLIVIRLDDRIRTNLIQRFDVEMTYDELYSTGLIPEEGSPITVTFEDGLLTLKPKVLEIKITDPKDEPLTGPDYVPWTGGIRWPKACWGCGETNHKVLTKKKEVFSQRIVKESDWELYKREYLTKENIARGVADLLASALISSFGVYGSLIPKEHDKIRTHMVLVVIFYICDSCRSKTGEKFEDYIMIEAKKVELSEAVEGPPKFTFSFKNPKFTEIFLDYNPQVVPQELLNDI